MVNGYLQSSIRAENFAGYDRHGGRFCLPRRRSINSYVIVIIRLFPVARLLHFIPCRRLGRGFGMHDGESRGDGVLRCTKGEFTDAECASRRPVAANVAEPRARRHRQQHRQHRHHGLQGRQRRVYGIPDAGRARQRVRHRQGSPRQLRRRPRHLDRFQPWRDAAHRQSARRRHRRQGLFRGADGARRSAIPATARCRSTPPASSSPAPAIRCLAPAGRSRFKAPIATSSSV